MGRLKGLNDLKIKFIVKLGSMGKYDDGVDKYHIIIPKQYGDQVKALKGKHVRVFVDDEI